ncbi:PLP-dependent aminotransferase family protein [Halomonas sp. H2]|uniref:aminotransferase-like domain-containing protein n=1 Tax=unclassified Halomonas TaxID=2609666 RepID=UPI003CEE694E
MPISMQRQTRAQRIASDIASQITEGILRKGDKLPSLREHMRLHGDSKNTVITAYDYLAAQGLVEARQGRGFFVLATPTQTNCDTQPLPYTRALDTTWMMRQQLVREPGHSHLGEGFPPVHWLMDMRLDKFHRQVVRGGITSLFRYGNRFGNASLREQLSKKIASYGINALPQQILTTYGANHGMDLIIRRFTQPGSTVLVETPGYYPLFGKLQLSGVRMLPVRREEDGPNIDDLNSLLIKERPTLFFMQSVCHNPTGTDISEHKARQILALAERHDLIVVENDAMADFKLSSASKLSALDQLGRTLYLGSFSKSVSAALRVGFIAGSEKLISELADIKMLLHIAGAEYAERTVDVILREGNYLRHLAKLQARLRTATAVALKILEELGAEVFCKPEQSLYLWARFPGIEDANQLTRHCMKQGVMLAPGAIFSVDRNNVVPWTRLNVAYVDDPAFRASLKF